MSILIRNTVLSAFVLLSIIISISNAEPIPFTLKRGVPEIEVTINDSIKASFIIDTGADHIYIDKSFAEKHGLLSGGKMPMRPTTGVDGKFESYQIFLRSLSIGETKQSVVSAVTIDLRAVVKDTSKGLPDGVLGYAFLKNYRPLLNYPESTINFTPQDSNLYNNHEIFAFPFVLSRHLIVVNVIVNDTLKTKMILDTGASFSVWGSKNSDTLSGSYSTAIKKINIGGKIRITNPDFLNREIKTIKAALDNVDFEGILGTSFLKGSRIVIDYEKQTLSFLRGLGIRWYSD